MIGFGRGRRRIFGDRSGAAAIEFALVAPLFFAIVFSTIEAGWLMTKAIMLDRAVERTVRQLRLGTLPDISYDGVKRAICREAMIFSDCQNSLLVELIPIKTAGDLPANNATCVDRSGTIHPTIRFDPGARAEEVFVRACIVVDPLTPFLGLGLALPKDASGGTSIVSSSAFMNEPE